MQHSHRQWATTLPGRVLRGRWTLGPLLGMGGSAAIFEAWGTDGGRVAVKVLLPLLAFDQRRRSRFLQEREIVSRVAHPRAVRFYDAGVEDDGTTFLVMERLTGDSIANLARRHGGTLPWLMVVDVVVGLLSVLECAHARGIVHRDVRAANLYWEIGAGLRVLDFGLAKALAPANSKLQRVVGARTKSRGAAPRRSTESELVNEDLWSVAATAFALLAGRPVYEGVRRSEQLALSSTRPAPVLAELAPEVPVRVCAAIQHALDCDTDRRWPSAGKMRAALEEAVTGHALESARSPADDDTDTASGTLDESDPALEVHSERAASSRRTLAWRSALLASLLVLACVVWWLDG